MGNGDPAAQTLLGVMLINGDGVSADKEAGYKWLEKAAKNGDAQEKTA